MKKSTNLLSLCQTKKVEIKGKINKPNISMLNKHTCKIEIKRSIRSDHPIGVKFAANILEIKN